MNADLSKYKGLSIPQQQERRRVEFRVNRCRYKRERLKALQLDAGPAFETNEEQLREAENDLAKFEARFAPPEVAADQAGDAAEPEPVKADASQKKRASKKR